MIGEKRLEIKPENLSIIIPTYNRKDVLIRNLEALQLQTVCGFEVVVVDDGSTDGTFEFLKFWKTNTINKLNYKLRISKQNNMRQAHARNHGLQLANGEIILFINDDIVPGNKFIESHLDGHKKYNAENNIAILGLTEWDNKFIKPTPFVNFVYKNGAQFGFGQLKPGKEAPFNYFYASNVSLSRFTLGNHPFDPRFDFYGWEDIELGYRLCSNGMKIIYHPKARADHCHSFTLSSFLKRQTLVGETVCHLIQKHPETANILGCSRTLFYGKFSPILACLAPILDTMDKISTRPWPPNFYKLILAIAFGEGFLKSNVQL